MLLRYFYDRALAQASYMVGCQATGEAMVIDPSRDIQPYLDSAAQEGLRIAHVTETHIHADFVSGARELAAATGATLYLSDEGGPGWRYGFRAERTVLLKDGATWMVGNVRVEAMHTPGHTPEHLIFQITDTAGANEPIGLFTGDLLFVGDIGRPDLLETAAGVTGSAKVGAGGQFRNVQRLKTLPDYLQVWPGHGAGSACGKALGAVPSTTLGYEKRFNPAFQIADEDAFVDWVLAEQPETPPYFAQMKRVNRDGPALVKDVPAPARLPAAQLDELVRRGALIIDTRSADDFTHGHIPGTISIPLGDKFSTYAGYLIDYAQPFYLIVAEAELAAVRRLLAAIGADDIAGYWTPESLPAPTVTLPTLAPDEAHLRIAGDGAYLLLDVRGQSEYSARHIAAARLLPLPFLARQLDHIPRDLPVIVHCASGTRSHIAASLLLARGFTQVAHIRGGLDAWLADGLPVVEG
jgi:hydroxyacylglutathione hydrolase